MERRREAAQLAAKERGAVKARTEEVVPCLRQLGYGAEEARRAAEYSAEMADASLEDRIRAALRYFLPRSLARGRAAVASAGS